MKLRSMAICTASVAAVLAAVGIGGVRVNTTGSLPKGLYIIVDEPLKIGAVVLVCPPIGQASEEGRARGYVGYSAGCPGHFQRLIKRVVGVPGMTVSTTTNGLLVINGREQPASSAKKTDSAGRPLAEFFSSPVTLSSGKFIVLGDTDKSFDSRYFGPVEENSIRAVMRPLFTY